MCADAASTGVISQNEFKFHFHTLPRNRALGSELGFRIISISSSGEIQSQ